MWTICWGSLHDGSWTRDLSIRHCNLILCTFLLLLRRRICDCVAEGKPAIIPYARTAAYFKPVLAVSQVEFKPARTASIHITMSSSVKCDKCWVVRDWLNVRNSRQSCWCRGVRYFPTTNHDDYNVHVFIHRSDKTET